MDESSENEIVIIYDLCEDVIYLLLHYLHDCTFNIIIYIKNVHSLYMKRLVWVSQRFLLVSISLMVIMWRTTYVLTYLCSRIMFCCFEISILSSIPRFKCTSQDPSNEHFQARVIYYFQNFNISQFSTRSTTLLRNFHFQREFLVDFFTDSSYPTSWSQPLVGFLFIFISNWGYVPALSVAYILKLFKIRSCLTVAK